jgi:NAD(P)H-dependent FMN reductase
MPRLLVVHHTPSPVLQEMLELVVDGARDDALEGAVEVVPRAALAATAVDVLEADGVVLGTPANLGYMSGALKHFFDTVYYPVLAEKAGTPFALYVHGGSDTAGAVRSVEKVTTGLSWRPVAAALTVAGALGPAEREACRELGGTAAATLVL